MSTARIDNIGPSAGGTTRKLVRGTAAAWANLNCTGTIALRDSENVSSVTDNRTGDYSFNVTSNFATSNNVGTEASEVGGGNGGFSFINSFSTSAWQFVAYTQAGSFRDVSLSQSAVFGDLA